MNSIVLLLAALYAAEGPCATARSEAVIAAEPGQRMIVTGQVSQPDGRTPAAGVIMYVYHTDAEGRYGSDSRGGPRLQAWLKTGVDGRYSYTTIRPGAYPDRKEPAHVHIQFWGNGTPPQWSRDLVFADDPLVTAKMREKSQAAGRFAFVAEPVIRERILYVRQDFRLKPAADEFEEVIRHGLRACGVQP